MPSLARGVYGPGTWVMVVRGHARTTQKEGGDGSAAQAGAARGFGFSPGILLIQLRSVSRWAGARLVC